MNYDQFYAAYTSVDASVDDAQIQEAFKFGDQDGNGFLTEQEFVELYEMGRKETEM